MPPELEFVEGFVLSVRVFGAKALTLAITFEP